ncbi:hypothetical protein INR49_021270 [Caranx melampygus]|nr:hypothetical protein INR49_021270 [Caranx melampygus]
MHGIMRGKRQPFAVTEATDFSHGKSSGCRIESSSASAAAPPGNLSLLSSNSSSVLGVIPWYPSDLLATESELPLLLCTDVKEFRVNGRPVGSKVLRLCEVIPVF